MAGEDGRKEGAILKHADRYDGSIFARIVVPYLPDNLARARALQLFSCVLTLETSDHAIDALCATSNSVTSSLAYNPWLRKI